MGEMKRIGKSLRVAAELEELLAEDVTGSGLHRGPPRRPRRPPPVRPGAVSRIVLTPSVRTANAGQHGAGLSQNAGSPAPLRMMPRSATQEDTGPGRGR